jgi:hypothetical protein
VNTRRLGAIVSGAVIGLGSLTPPWLWRCLRGLAALTALALVAIRVAARITKGGADMQDREIASKGEPQGHP